MFAVVWISKRFAEKIGKVDGYYKFLQRFKNRLNIMKKILALAIIMIATIQFATAQNALSGSKWSGSIFADQQYPANLEFSKDSFVVYVNNEAMEYMSYAVSGDTIKVRRLSGSSGCGEEEGVFTFKIVENILTFSAINDNCSMRVNAFDPKGYKLEGKL